MVVVRPELEKKLRAVVRDLGSAYTPIPIIEQTVEKVREDLERRQLALITRKSLLGDGEAQRIAEEHGPMVTQIRAKGRARVTGRCACARFDGIICGRPASGDGPKCWPCWSAARNGKLCVHWGEVA